MFFFPISNFSFNMELIIKKFLHSDFTQTIGENIQSLQVVLPKQHSFIVKNENITYFSQEIESEVFSEQVFMTVKQTYIDKHLITTYLTKLKNNSNNVAYVGINMTKGIFILNFR